LAIDLEKKKKNKVWLVNMSGVQTTDVVPVGGDGSPSGRTMRSLVITISSISLFVTVSMGENKELFLL
jgi:hypothetical protein